MADITPIPTGGALPPKPAEAAKIQPKKETVRINLPPKPTAAPTIKLPTLSPGAPAPVMAASAAAPSAVTPSARTPAPAQPPTSGGPRTAAPPAAHKPGPAASAPRAMPADMGELTTLDKGLAIAAAVATLAGLAALVYLKFFLTDTAGS
jgi:hypothetical protein